MVPGPLGARPAPNPRAMQWAGWASKKRQAGRSAGWGAGLVMGLVMMGPGRGWRRDRTTHSAGAPAALAHPPAAGPAGLAPGRWGARVWRWAPPVRALRRAAGARGCVGGGGWGDCGAQGGRGGEGQVVVVAPGECALLDQFRVERAAGAGCAGFICAFSDQAHGRAGVDARPHARGLQDVPEVAQQAVADIHGAAGNAAQGLAQGQARGGLLEPLARALA